MSLNFHSYVIAEPQIVGLFGERGLGIGSLRFSVMFTLVNSTEGDPAMYIDGLRATVSVLPTSGGARYLGAGEFEGPHILRRLGSTRNFRERSQSLSPFATTATSHITSTNSGVPKFTADEKHR